MSEDGRDDRPAPFDTEKIENYYFSCQLKSGKSMLTPSQIEVWFKRGLSQQKSHMLVVRDGFDYEYYPVYSASPDDVAELLETYNDVNMQRVMEVYDLLDDPQKQLKAKRAWAVPGDQPQIMN